MRGKKIENEFEKILKKDIDGKMTTLKIQRIFSENDIPKEYLPDFIEFLEKKDIKVEEVGKVFGITRERIRQIEAKALRKLRNPSKVKRLKDFLE